MPQPKKEAKIKTTSAPAVSKTRVSVVTNKTDKNINTSTTSTVKARSGDDLLSRREMLFVVMRMEEMKKKNERLHTTQEMKYGMTLDGLNDMQKDIDHAKSINNSLLDELELRKARYDRLEADMVELKKRFEQCQTELKQLKREQKVWKETDQKLVETESKYQTLIKSNRSLRALLMKHSIDQGSVASVPSTPTRLSRREEATAKAKHIVWK